MFDESFLSPAQKEAAKVIGSSTEVMYMCLGGAALIMLSDEQRKFETEQFWEIEPNGATKHFPREVGVALQPESDETPLEVECTECGRTAHNRSGKIDCVHALFDRVEALKRRPQTGYTQSSAWRTR